MLKTLTDRSRGVLERLLKGASNEERMHYEKRYDDETDDGKLKLLNQILSDGFTDYDVRIERDGLLFTFPCNFGYYVQAGKFFDSNALFIFGPHNIRGYNYLENARVYAICNFFQGKNFDWKNCNTISTSDARIVYFDNNGNIPKLSSLMD